MVGFWLLESSLKQKLNLLRNSNSKIKSILLFISLYLIYAIGLTYSENFQYGLFDMEIKLSFLIFPIIMSTKEIEYKTEAKVEKMEIEPIIKDEDIPEPILEEEDEEKKPIGFDDVPFEIDRGDQLEDENPNQMSLF